MCEVRLKNLIERVSQSDDEDHIWGEGNTARRILERALKLEVCNKFLDAQVKNLLSGKEKKNLIPRSYKHLTIGDLVSCLKHFYEPQESDTGNDARVNENLNMIKRIPKPKAIKEAPPIINQTRKNILEYAKRAKEIADKFSHDNGEDIGKKELNKLCGFVACCIFEIKKSMELISWNDTIPTDV